MTGQGPPLVEARGITKSLGGRVILDDIDLEIGERDRIALVGRVGSGKTTLINVIGGVGGSEPDHGEVIYHVSVCELCGRVDFATVSECPRCKGVTRRVDFDYWGSEDTAFRHALRDRIGIMFQKSFGVYGSLTALENIVQVLETSGVGRAEAYKRAAEVLDRVNLMHRSSHLANDMSGGEKQRLVLARQLVKEPIILFADDPTGALDPGNASMISKTLRSLDKGALLVTSHIPALVENVCTKALLLEDGRIAEEGEPKKIMRKLVADVPPSEPSQRRGDGEPIVRVSGVEKIYHKATSGIVKAVDGVDLTINEGAIFGLVGKSGAGKTTLSKMIAGAIKPTKGSVLVRIGEDWVDLRQPGPLGKGRATRYIGVLYQEYSLYSHMTVFDNLAKSKALNIPDEFIKMKAVHTLKRIGFDGDRINQLLTLCPDDLSEGERHRVALAWALMKDPRILILDEPSGTMDPITKVEVSHALRSLREEFGTTIVIVSHDAEFSLRTCDVMALMDAGKVVRVGTPEEVIADIDGATALYAIDPRARAPIIPIEEELSRREID
ncbi:MAG: methyl coenzyme M reductase system, component A2 [Methanomassiliicoccales archaeon]|jgi:methyl coenzyme M reductase system subunit A2